MPSVTTDVLKPIDSGVLCIANKRVIFDGSLGNKSLRLSSLLGFTPSSDGIGLEKSTGKSPAITLNGDAAMAHVILGAVLARS